jgi:hypothetical protein
MPVITSFGNPTITALNNIGTTALQVIGFNSGRALLRFHNPGAVDIIVFPTLVWIAGSPVTLLPGTTLALGGGYRVYGNGGDQVIDTDSRFFAWLAQAVSGTNNSLTIEEST